MSNPTISPDVARRIQKLHDKAASAERIGNAAEAAAFAAKVSELLARYELSMSDIEWANLDETDPMGRQFYGGSDFKEAGVKWTQRRRAWQEDLLRVLCHHFGCQFLVVTGSNSFTIVGRKNSREALAFVFFRLARELLRLQSVEYRRAGRYERDGFKASYRRGFIDGVRAQLKEQRDAIREEFKSDSKALIRLDRGAIESREYVDRMKGIRSVSNTRERWTGHAAARNAGFRAGYNANTSANGVGRGESGPRRLGSGS